MKDDVPWNPLELTPVPPENPVRTDTIAVVGIRSTDGLLLTIVPLERVRTQADPGSRSSESVNHFQKENRERRVSPVSVGSSRERESLPAWTENSACAYTGYNRKLWIEDLR